MKYKLVLVNEEGTCEDAIVNIEEINKEMEIRLTDTKDIDDGVDANQVMNDLYITWKQMEKNRRSK